ncbi:Uncharacterized protein AXF42_Ash003947 [Apostasia shenzhenica]|uniref:Glutaredoxin domain-containing protein n=1 Tax=Apostasia shenzhenica TaxID=1088818 RepID=A0A2I0AIE7_9ASPA|nr:Uncharacterized protein AXF42_Ash003947 [Apostasia shenzhenica]
MSLRLGKISRSGDSAAVDCSPATPSFKDLYALLRDDEHGARAADGDARLGRRKAAVFHRVLMATAALRTWLALPALAISDPGPPPPAEDRRIVLYYTSLRVVRTTFEDCRAVRSILRGFRVAVDERDLAMDLGFLAELKGLLGQRQLSLPRIFIGGRYIGGSDEIRQLHESGELKRQIEGVQPAPAGSCEACGGVRFILCPSCNGSHKYYSEKGGFRACASCNENGLVRCPRCCSSVV